MGGETMSNFTMVASASKRITEALNLRSMKAAELSERSGISKPSISCYISGKYEPKQNALYKMGKVLDVSEMWLAGYDVPMERPRTQKDNDAMSDLIEQLHTDSDFRRLAIKESKLKPESRALIEGIVDSMKD